LEELEDADLFLHVVDAADPSWEGQIRAVEKILAELEFHNKTRIIVFNKTDLISQIEIKYRRACVPGSAAISALDRGTLMPLLEAMEIELFKEKEFDTVAWQSLGF